MKIKMLLLGTFLLCLSVFAPISKSYAFGVDLGKKCWVGDTSGVSIQLQITQLGAIYNVNGTVTTATATNAVFGTAFLDTTVSLVKVAYTIIVDAGTVAYPNHALLKLDPVTLNGNKILSSIGAVPETVTSTPCP